MKPPRKPALAPPSSAGGIFEWCLAGSGRLAQGCGVGLWLWALWCGPLAWAQMTIGDPEQHLEWGTLSAETARQGLPVRFDGTVLCYDLAWGQLYVYDGRQAIYLDPRAFANQFEIGQRVKINGTTAWGRTVAVLTNQSARVLERVPLPEAPQLKVRDLFVQDASGGMRVVNSGTQWLQIGEQVDVLGFPSLSDFSPSLEEAAIRSKGLTDATALMEQQEADLGEFMTNDARGKHLLPYFKQLAERSRAENATLAEELTLLRKNIEHIKDIVARQQSLAKVGGVLENVAPEEIMEDALAAVTGLARAEIAIQRAYAPKVGEILLEKHKLLQILVNLISNARNACVESDVRPGEILLGIEEREGTLRMWVKDNGMGITPENLARIFHHGFTTRKGGHGFGLHSSALFAQQMGGKLLVHSDGPGRGALFTLELPADS